MAFNFYKYGYAELLRGNIDLLTDTISILSIRTSHTPDFANDQDLADITSTDRDAHSAVTLGTKAIADDAGFTAANVTIPAGSGAECDSFLVYKHTGTDATATLICMFSGAAYTYTPDTNTRDLTWSGDVFNLADARGFAFGMAEIMRLNVDLLTDDIKLALIDEADYTVNLATHQDLDDASAGVVGTAVNLSSKTISDAGVFDAADVTLSSVSGDATEAAMLYLDSGSSATSTLLRWDSESAIEVTPNGSDITVLTPNGFFGMAA